MSIEKKSLISNRAATKKANLTKVNPAAQVSATKVANTMTRTKVANTMTRTKVLVRPAVGSKISATMIHSKVSIN